MNSLPPPRVWKPFPVHLLPEPARSFVVQTSVSLGCDPAIVALPVLATMASAIGNARVIRLNPIWIEVSVLWTVLLSESGTQKSPAIKMAVAPLVRRQNAFAGGDAVVPALGDAPTSLSNTAPPPHCSDTLELQLLVSPKSRRLVVDDITIESLAERLQDAPHGLLLVDDELSTWLRAATRGANAARWLRVYGAGTLDVDRKTRSTWIHIERAAVSICGGIQPGIMRELIAPRHFELGLVPRLLLAHPPRQKRVWTTATVAPAVLAAYDQLIVRLLRLRPAALDGGALPPIELGLQDDALHAWVEFFNRHADRQYEAEGNEAAMLSKIEGVAARLALVLYCARTVGATPATVPVQIDAESMLAGVQLAEWFAFEAERVYEEFRRSSEEQRRAEFVEWIEHHGGRVTVRGVQLGPRRYRGSAKLAERALQDLVDNELGAWEDVPPGPLGGPGTVEFVLATATQPSDPGSNAEAVSPSPVETVTALDANAELAP